MSEPASLRDSGTRGEVAVTLAAAAEPVGPFFHAQAIVESSSIGRGTRIWAFAHVLPGAKIGEECNICDGVFIENDVLVGDRVTVKCGVQLWDGVTLEDDVFVGPNATFTNDPFPRSRRRPTRFERTIVRRGASIGANATILPGLVIGESAMVGAGAVVTRDVPPHAVVVGNPARVVETGRSSDAQPAIPIFREPPTFDSTVAVEGVRMVSLLDRSDARGRLTVGEVTSQLPFVPQRYFVISDVRPGAIRGGHAHKQCEQFFVCLHGACTLSLEDGIRSTSLRLDSPTRGVHAAASVWATLSDFTEGAVLLVLASDPYEAADYVRDYTEFLREHRG